MGKEDKMIISGKIVGVERNRFLVECEHGIVKATLSGKIRTRASKCVLSDCVEVEVGAYSLFDGRIVRRL